MIDAVNLLDMQAPPEATQLAPATPAGKIAYTKGVLAAITKTGARVTVEDGRVFVDGDHSEILPLLEQLRPLKSDVVLLASTRDKLRRQFETICARIERLRSSEGTAKADRSDCVAWLNEAALKFADACDTAAGYYDWDDPFAEEALATVCIELAELTFGAYPLPDGTERRANGKLL